VAFNAKILVVRVGHAGDLVMITPALAGLLEGFPDAEIHVLTSREGRRVMADYHPRLTRTWLYDRRFPQRLWREPKLARDLQDQGYTRVYLFETNPQYRRWLHAVAPEFRAIEPTTADAHFSERCLAVVTESLAVPPPKRWIELPVTEAGLAAARALLAAHGVNPDDHLVGLHPTFSGSSLSLLGNRGKRHRHWPATSFAQLACLLQGEANKRGLPLRIIIDALPDERALIEPIVRQSAGAVTVITAAPDFARYKAMLRCMDVLVTPNTGPMHIAAAVGTPVVALFSGWSADDCGPYVPADRYVTLSAEDTAQPEHGLAAITPQQVVTPVFSLLGAG
jgi:ADP-heptose:LPS heptosyltransferase